MCGDEVAGVPAVEADLERDAGPLDGGDDPVGVGERHRHRLLDEDRLARLGRGDAELGVRGRGARDRDGVDVGCREQLGGIGDGPRSEAVAECGRDPGCRVGHGDKLHARQALGQRAGVVRADPACADEAESQRCLGCHGRPSSRFLSD